MEHDTQSSRAHGSWVPLAALAALGVLAPVTVQAQFPGAGSHTGFAYTAGFGAATNIRGFLQGGGMGVGYGVAPFDDQLREKGGEETPQARDTRRVHLFDAAQASSGAADARTGMLTASVVNVLTCCGPGTASGNGRAIVKFYDTFTVEADTAMAGETVQAALAWKLQGRFLELTREFAGSATLFILLRDPDRLDNFKTILQTSVRSHEVGAVDMAACLDLDAEFFATTGRRLTVGERFILEAYLFVDAASPPLSSGTTTFFTASFLASALPFADTPGVRLTGRMASGSRQEFAQRECASCAQGVVPKSRPNVVFIPARYRDSATALTFEEVTERIIYVKDYFFQQSNCSVEINPITMADPSTDGWFDLPGTKAQYDAIPPDGANNFQRTSSIWIDAFLAAAVLDPAFVTNQQTGGVDAIVVITNDADVRSRAYITRSLAGRLDVLDGIIDLLLPLGGGIIKDLALVRAQCVGQVILAPPLNARCAGPLKDTLFKQGSVITTDTDATGTWAHELGHALFTFWDYYATAELFVRGGIRGEGGQHWGLMADGDNVPPSPVITYNKEIAGWLKYKDIPATGFGDYSLAFLKDLAFGAETLRYQSPKGPVDWYIFELRTPPDDVPRAPDQALITGRWQGVEFNGTDALLTDTLTPAPFGRPNSQRGKFIRPNTQRPHQFEILGNTSTTVRIAGDQRGIVAVADPYTIDLSRVLQRQGNWEDVGFDGTNTILTDNAPLSRPFRAAGSQVGRLVRPNTTRPEHFEVLANTDSRVTIAGDQRTIASAGDTYRMTGGTTPGFGQTGIVIYQKREPNLLTGKTPFCGAIHGFPQHALNVLFGHSFGSCLEKIHNVNLFPVGSRDQFTLVPGTSYLDDVANVEFSLSDAMVLSIKGSAKSRTVVSLDSRASVASGGSLNSLIARGDLTLPIDLHIVSHDGRHAGPNNLTGEYELEIGGSRAGGAFTPTQWISVPDDVAASFLVDASQAVANARALGVHTLDIEATVSVIHYDASGVVSELGAPLVLTLDLDHATSAPIPIPVAGVTDTTAPATTATPTPGPNVHGWNNSEVTVTLAAADGPDGSGVADIRVQLTGAQIGESQVAGATASLTITAEGVTMLTYFARDRAGNTESPGTLTVRIDRTPPTISGSRTPGPNAFGWNNTDVEVTFTCADAGSGIESCGPSPQVVSTEGAGQVRTGTAVDRAGNVAVTTVGEINLDRTPPAISGLPAPGCLLWPPDHRLVPVASVSASDALSGLAPSSLSVTGSSNEPENGLGDGDSAPDIIVVGGVVQLRAERAGEGTGRVYTLTSSATDLAGNVATATASCSVPHDRRR